jgi:hypothetical protein
MICIELHTIPPLHVHRISPGAAKPSTNAKDMHIWGCRVLVPVHNLKKSQDRALEEKNYGFAKTRSLLRWLDVANDNIKHVHGARFLELDCLHPDPPIEQKLLDLDLATMPSDIECPHL